MRWQIKAYRSFASNGVRVGIVMAQEESLHGSHRVDPEARVQVANVQLGASPTRSIVRIASI